MNIYKFDKKYKFFYMKSSDHQLDLFLKPIDDESKIILYNYTEDNNIFRIEHFKNMNYHNENGPARIFYNVDNGSIKMVEYWVKSKAHRIDGPSDIYYDEDGNIVQERWFYDNNDYSDIVGQWLRDNGFRSYEEMSDNDFNRMWMEIV